MTDYGDKRRASRTIVEIDAELVAAGATLRGSIHDLSFLGSLFITDEAMAVEPGARGLLRFVLPNSTSWFTPSVEVRRSTTFPRPLGRSAQAVGFAFSGLTINEERAIALVCYEWSSLSARSFPLAAQCFVQGLDDVQNFSRFARLTGGSRREISFRFEKSVPLKPGQAVRLKIRQTSVSARITEVYQSRLGIEVQAHLEGWGADFFLHEARSPASGAVRPG